jgi:hypothetical protein
MKSKTMATVSSSSSSTSRYKPYPRYKDSGVEWLGKIPEAWEVKRLRLHGGDQSLEIGS